MLFNFNFNFLTFKMDVDPFVDPGDPRDPLVDTGACRRPSCGHWWCP